LDVLRQFPQTLFRPATTASKLALELLFHAAPAVPSLQFLDELIICQAIGIVQELSGITSKRPPEVRELIRLFPAVVDSAVLKLDQESLEASLAIELVWLQCAAVPVS
jgi:hypothetical protein